MLVSPESTKNNRRKRRKSNDKQGNLFLKSILPLTDSQKDAFESYYEKANLLLHGCPGTGKTFIGLYLALESILVKNEYKKLIIIRSAVPSRQIGFMPGNEKEKIKHYEVPYENIVGTLLNRDDGYSVLKSKNFIEFTTTSFLRGTTFDNSVILVDEIQNMSSIELHTIITRVGENSRIIFCGDIKQDDLTSERYHEESGIEPFLDIIEEMKEFEFVEFDIPDIVRSTLLKSYIIARNKLGL